MSDLQIASMKLIRSKGNGSSMSDIMNEYADLVKENAALRAIKAGLLEALRKAADLVSSEYCSHDGDCGPDIEECYAREIYQAIAKAGGK